MRRLLSVALVAIASVLLISNSGGLVQAQSAGLGIVPRRDMVIEPGKNKTDELAVTNLSNEQTLDLTLQVVDFGAQDETGTPSLKLSESAAQTPWSLKPFLKAPSTLKIAPGKTEKVRYTINVPSGQGAGSYYSAIRYVAEGGDAGQVAISASGATLVFVTVPGKTKESLTLQKFGAYEISKGQTNGKYRSLFVSSSPKELAFTVKNQGNVAEQPAGSIMIKDTFGKQVKIIKDANPKASLALIDQTRRFQVCIDEPGADQNDNNESAACKSTSLMPGRYTATLNVLYGLNGNQTQEILATASFWYLPTWFLAVLAVLVGAIAAAGFMIYRRVTGVRGFSGRKK